MDFLKQYWPAFVGTIILIVAGKFLWPEGGREVAPERTSALQPIISSDPGSDAAAEPLSERQVVSKRGQIPTEESENAAEDRFEIRETVIAVPIDEAQLGSAAPPSDEEAKRALGQVEVVLYETNECQFCRKAREFFAHNKVNYRAQDVNSDERIRLKAKQLSGGTGVPVIVIDGQVLRGFSEGSVQTALSSAVQRRVMATR